ncbi:MAG: ethanolamine ammonia-lyase light chain EutC, partial [Cytophagales bacterium]|nr:ethanolamine ammonia-lyase light chain EutC [Cytophagales bacterium]
QRPDLGRRLSDESKVQWNGYVSSKEFDIQIIVADGLSSRAVHRHVIPLLDCFLGKIPSSFTFAPLAIVRYGRVAISDEIGEISRSKLSIILLGERPGLSAPDSLGIYLTYRPAVGLTDESRNCISNIRGGGLSYDLAADKLVYLSMEAIRLKLSGVGLKENGQLLNN